MKIRFMNLSELKKYRSENVIVFGMGLLLVFAFNCTKENNSIRISNSITTETLQKTSEITINKTVHSLFFNKQNVDFTEIIADCFNFTLTQVFSILYGTACCQ